MNQTPKDQADAILDSIQTAKALLAEAIRQANVDIEAITAKHQPTIEGFVAQIDKDEKRLEKLTKKHRKQIMGDGDRADLAHGSVMLKTVTRVKQIKGMLDRLKAAGLTAAVRVVKEAVDWDSVEKFDDATLAELGTERKASDHFSYEVKWGANG